MIAAQFGKDFDRIVSECNTDIEVARQKRAERAAKKKERAEAAKTARTEENSTPVTEQTQETTTRPPVGRTFRITLYKLH